MKIKNSSYAHGKKEKDKKGKKFTAHQRSNDCWTPILTYIEDQDITLQQVTLLGIRKADEVTGSTFSTPSYLLMPRTKANPCGHPVEVEAKRNNIIPKVIKKKHA